MKPSILYKQHDNDNCDTLQSIVRYMYANQIGDIRPSSIVERCMPASISVLPTISFENGYKLEGLDAIVNYYEKVTKIANLVDKTNNFAKLNPDYRITDKATHKKLIL